MKTLFEIIGIDRNNHQMDWATFVGNLSTICTIGLFLTGIQICHKIRSQGTTGDISSLPFTSTFTNCFLWFLYGILKSNPQISVVNAVGFTLQACYTLFYLTYTPNKKKLIHQIIFAIVVVIVVFTYAFEIETNIDQSSFVVGLVASTFGVIMFGSPLASLKHVIKTQSTESLSFPLCCANFIVASEWFVYGYLINDYFVMVPNGIGSLLGFTQVSLFCKFPSQSIATKSRLKENIISP